MKSLIASLSIFLFVMATCWAGILLPIDTNHSTIGFSTPILGGLSEVTGKFTEFEITFEVNEKDMAKSTLKAVIVAESIDTGIDQRDRHLRSRDFFDVRKFPEIVFESKEFKKTETGYVAVGSLTMHGVSKAIELPIRVTGRHDRKDGKTWFGFTVDMHLDRDDYGIAYRHNFAPFIGTEIRVQLRIVTRLRDFGDLTF